MHLKVAHYKSLAYHPHQRKVARMSTYTTTVQTHTFFRQGKATLNVDQIDATFQLHAEDGWKCVFETNEKNSITFAEHPRSQSIHVLCQDQLFENTLHIAYLESTVRSLQCDVEAIPKLWEEINSLQVELGSKEHKMPNTFPKRIISYAETDIEQSENSLNGLHSFGVGSITPIAGFLQPLRVIQKDDNQTQPKLSVRSSSLERDIFEDEVNMSLPGNSTLKKNSTKYGALIPIVCQCHGGMEFAHQCVDEGHSFAWCYISDESNCSDTYIRNQRRWSPSPCIRHTESLNYLKNEIERSQNAYEYMRLVSFASIGLTSVLLTWICFMYVWQKDSKKQARESNENLSSRHRGARSVSKQRNRSETITDIEEDYERSSMTRTSTYHNEISPAMQPQRFSERLSDFSSKEESRYQMEIKRISL